MNINTNKFFLIAGPCVVESKDICFKIAEQLAAITTELNIPFVFKASYKKANRSKLDSFTTIGEEKALQILADIKSHFNIPILTDVHETTDCKLVKEIVDVIQIPAFLCRQTDLLIAAAHTGKIVNVKKGQFVSGEAMQFAVNKIKNAGNEKVLLTERGTTFGYQDLVVDYRNLPIMQQYAPVVMDVTHSLQQPNQTSGVTGGHPQMISTIAKAAIAAGADGLFIETHPQPAKALSDGANMLQLDLLESLLENLTLIRKAVL